MEVIANEVRYVENLLKNKKLTARKANKEIRLVVQYYLSNFFSIEDTTENTIEFINQVNNDNSGEKWRKTIAGMIKDLIKKNDLKLREINSVSITEKEWSVIEKLEKDYMKRYAFGLLVYSKVLNHEKESKWVVIENTSTFLKDVGVSANSENREKYFNALKKEGLITIAKKTASQAICVDFEEKDGIPMITIPEEQINNFITYFEEQNGYSVLVCPVCNNRFTLNNKKGRKQSYCKKCVKERNKLRKQKERGEK